MTNRTTDRLTPDQFVTTMTEQMERMARALRAWGHANPHTLQEIEAHVVRLVHELGTALLSGMCQLVAPSPAPDIPCPCGAQARYLRFRPATVTTVLGPIPYTRASYQCPTCRPGATPRDAQLQVCAGGRSAGLHDLLAFLGATPDSVAQAPTILERLGLVQVCPNRVRAATEELGQVLLAHDQQVIQTAQQTDTPPATMTPVPARRSISMDGVVAHTHEAGWKEITSGCVYTTRTRVPRQRPEHPEIRAEAQRYVAALTDATTFGWHLWADACHRGLDTADEVVVLGDGAHWIWNVAEAHFPQATQILDWYHASQYVWNAATAIYGEGGDLRAAWAHTHLDALWEGGAGMTCQAAAVTASASGTLCRMCVSSSFSVTSRRLCNPVSMPHFAHTCAISTAQRPRLISQRYARR
jgi:hypothetical protein